MPSGVEMTFPVALLARGHPIWMMPPHVLQVNLKARR